MNTIISISGDKGSGKNTLGMILQALTIPKIYSSWSNRPLEYLEKYKDHPNFQGGWQIKSFAEPLKQFAANILGISDVALFESQNFKNSYLPECWDKVDSEGNIIRMTHRDFLQKLATDAIRNNFHDNFWVNAMFSKSCENIIITDTRFTNEIEAIKQRNGYFVRIYNSSIENNDSHISEHQWKSHTYDYNVDNSSFDYLVLQAKQILKNIGYENTNMC